MKDLFELYPIDPDLLDEDGYGYAVEGGRVLRIQTLYGYNEWAGKKYYAYAEEVPWVGF